jgi:hypothetical protein
MDEAEEDLDDEDLEDEGPRRSSSSNEETARPELDDRTSDEDDGRVRWDDEETRGAEDDSTTETRTKPTRSRVHDEEHEDDEGEEDDADEDDEPEDDEARDRRRRGAARRRTARPRTRPLVEPERDAGPATIWSSSTSTAWCTWATDPVPAPRRHRGPGRGGVGAHVTNNASRRGVRRTLLRSVGVPADAARCAHLGGGRGRAAGP